MNLSLGCFYFSLFYYIVDSQYFGNNNILNNHFAITVLLGLIAVNNRR
jgi:hypothetical protein